MRVALLTIGSQGDARPFIALGTGLQAAGHEVRVAAPADFAALAAANNLEFRPIMESFEEFLRSPEGQRAFAALRVPWRGLVHGGMVPEEKRARVLHDATRACSGAEAIVCNLNASWFAAPIARAGRRRLAVVHLMPDLATRHFPHPLFPAWGLGNWYRRATFAFANRGAPRYATDDVPLPLVAISPSVLERPNDWPAKAELTGYWFAPSGAQSPPPELERFVAAGPPPVYVGFGSTLDSDPVAIERVLLEALEQLGVRAVFVRGIGTGLARSRERLLPIDSADFDWLLPRVAAAVHHGGAGTAAACVKAGIPQLIVPFGYDHAYWGRRMLDLGVAAACIPRRKLTAARLAESLRRALGDGEMRRRAAELGARVRAEDGIARAVELLEKSWRPSLSARESAAPRGPAPAARG